MQQLLTPLILHLPAGQDHQPLSWATLQTYPHLHHFTSQHPDLIWINQADEGVGIEEVRDLQQLLGFGAYQSQGRLVILLHADTASLPAQNALLKLLEEPPAGTQLVLTATQPEVFLPTVLSRCLVVKTETKATSAEAAAETTLPETIGLLLSTPDQLSWHELLQLSEQFGDRGEALDLLEKMLQTCHKLHSSNPTPTSTHHLKTLLLGQSWLKSNVNVKLALTECFFGLKKAHNGILQR